MKNLLPRIMLLAALTLANASAMAQTSQNGPYYASPSWDQQIPTSQRFIALSNWNNAAVLDRETGLVWERSPSSPDANWTNAQYACIFLRVANRLGWRLPTVQELASLMDQTASDPPLPPGSPFTIALGSYWSATNYSAEANSAWIVGLYYNGGFSSATKDQGLHVWCVRGGQVVNPQ